jgi:hypothetical protein
MCRPWLRALVASAPPVGAKIRPVVNLSVSALSEQEGRMLRLLAVRARATGWTCRTTGRQRYRSDPVHDGNRDMVAWQLIGFPAGTRESSPRRSDGRLVGARSSSAATVGARPEHRREDSETHFTKRSGRRVNRRRATRIGPSTDPLVRPMVDWCPPCAGCNRMRSWRGWCQHDETRSGCERSK